MRTRRLAPAALLALLLLGVAGLTSCTPQMRAVDVARAQVGAPYVSGGASPSKGFDCSGLTSYAWGQAGITLPRTSAQQYTATTRIERADLEPGDLVFYSASGPRGAITHVAMFVGDDTIMHARKPGIPAREDKLSTWWTANLVGYGRVKA